MKSSEGVPASHGEVLENVQKATVEMCGFVRAMGESDGSFDRLWTKCYEDAKGDI